MTRNNSGDTTLFASPVDRLFPMGTVLLLAGALLIAVPVLSALPTCLTMGSASASGCMPGGPSIFDNALLITSPWAEAGIALGVLGVGLRFGRHRLTG